MSDRLTIGVLALQGDFDAHARAFARLGCDVREVRRREELAAVDGLVLPGGETTTLIKLMRAFDLWDAVRRAPEEGRALFGTCAGLILLAERVTDPEQDSLGLLPVAVQRNAYGRQVDSFAVPGQVRVPEDLRADLDRLLRATGHGLAADEPLQSTEFVFIRAPLITAVSPPVEVLARQDGAPILVRGGPVLGASFHPELMSDNIVTGLFTAMVAQVRRARLRGGNGGRRARPHAVARDR